MTTELDVLSPAPPALPKTERRAHIPAGFLAGGLAAGIKASGRPGGARGPARGGRGGGAARPRGGELVAGALGIGESEVLHLSTGVIGTRLPLDKVAAGLGALVPELAATGSGLEAGAGALPARDS